MTSTSDSAQAALLSLAEQGLRNVTRSVRDREKPTDTMDLARDAQRAVNRYRKEFGLEPTSETWDPDAPEFENCSERPQAGQGAQVSRDQDKSDLFGPSGADYEHRKSEVLPPTEAHVPGTLTCVVRTRFAPLRGAMMTHRACRLCGYREYYEGPPTTPWESCPNCKSGTLGKFVVYDYETVGAPRDASGLPGAWVTLQWCNACGHREQAPTYQAKSWLSCPACGIQSDGTHSPLVGREGALDTIFTAWCRRGTTP